MARQQIMSGGYTSLAEEKRNEREAAREKKMRDMLQAAAVASRMNDQTAIGFGLGALLANNWDKWFGGKGGNKTDGQGGNRQYDFSKNMAEAKDPMQFAINGGDPHAKWAAEHNKPFSLMAVVQNPATISAAPMPNNFTVDGVDQQTIANAQLANNPAPMPTLTVDGNGVQGMNSGAFNTTNPANSYNFSNANGGFTLGGALGSSTSPWSNNQNHQLADIDFLKNKYPWEVK